MFKEINRKIPIITILVLVEFNLTYCMKTTNFCRIKQVKEESDSSYEEEQMDKSAVINERSIKIDE